MQKFRDGWGRRWEVAVDQPRVQAVRAQLGLDLPGLVVPHMGPLSALLQDPPTLAAVLYALCHEQALPQGVSADGFRAMLKDPATADAAACAFCQELFDACCPSRGLEVRRMPGYDAAMAKIMHRSSDREFDLTVPMPPDPAVPRPEERRP